MPDDGREKIRTEIATKSFRSWLRVNRADVDYATAELPDNVDRSVWLHSADVAMEYLEARDRELAGVREELADAKKKTASAAVMELRAQMGVLYKTEESREEYGYRQAYERICDWFEFEFSARGTATQPTSPMQSNVQPGTVTINGVRREGFLPCYRGGHPCDDTVETRETDTDTTTECRCRCCGDLKWMSSMPHDLAEETTHDQ
jgi:hypothetical protein